MMKPFRLEAADFVRTVRGYIIPEGQDWRYALKPEYWDNIVGNLNPGDRIEVHSSDHRVQFEVLVFSANDRADAIRLDIGFRPIFWPLDLPLPAPILRPEAYKARPS